MNQRLRRASVIVLCTCVAFLLAAAGHLNKARIIAHAEETYWQPTQFAREVPAGDAVEFTASFVPHADFEDVVVRLGPGLEGFARVQPSTLREIGAGIPVNFSIQLIPPGNANPRKLDSDVSLETSDGDTIHGSRLPVMLTVLSPNLQGIDENDNGVWDYMDIFIRSNVEEEVWPASNQLVKALQDGILYGSDPELASAKMRLLDRAIGCLYSVRPENAARIIKHLEASALNTSIRSKAYIAFGEQLAGSTTYVSVDAGKSQCDFD